MQSTVSIASENGRRPGSEPAHVFYLVLIVCFALDQLSKHLILFFLGEGFSRDFFRFFSFTCLKNKGICFGLLGSGSARLPVVLGSLLVLVLVWWYIRRASEMTGSLQSALGLIAGGILGNLVDRIRYGAVVDFLNFHVWPVFNLADACLVTGVLLLLFLRFKGRPNIPHQLLT